MTAKIKDWLRACWNRYLVWRYKEPFTSLEAETNQGHHLVQFHTRKQFERHPWQIRQQCPCCGKPSIMIARVMNAWHDGSFDYHGTFEHC